MMFRVIFITAAIVWASYLGWGVARIWHQNTVAAQQCHSRNGSCTGD